jgi:hypothetical protein
VTFANGFGDTPTPVEVSIEEAIVISNAQIQINVIQTMIYAMHFFNDKVTHKILK